MSGPMYDLGAAAIRPDAPGGDSVRDDPRYDRLEEIFQGLDIPNWSEVVKLTTELLKNTGKDVKVAARLGVGLLETRSWAGLVDGYTCWTGLFSEEMWEHLQPKRPRGRATAISWFADRVATVARAAEPTAQDLPVLKEARKLALEFEDLLEQRMGESAPEVVSVARILKGYVDKLDVDDSAPTEMPTPSGDPFALDSFADPFADPPAAPPEPDPAPGPETPAAAAEAPAPEAPPAVEAKAPPARQPVKTPKLPPAPAEGADLKDALKAFGQMKTSVLKTLKIIRDADSSQAMTYLIARAWTWAQVEEPSHKSNVTIIAAPPAKDKENWDELAAAGEWQQLLQSSEKRWPLTMLWLDPHRYAAQALAELGHEHAREAVCRGVGSFVGRVPALLDLQFADGTPLADEQTAAWIRSECLGGGGGAGGSSSVLDMFKKSKKAPEPVADEPESAEMEEDKLFAEVQKLLKKRKFAEAVVRFEPGLARVSDRRTRFRWKLRFAQLLVGAERWGAARPLLEALDEEVRRFDLENWEPALAVEVSQGLLVALNGKGHPDASTPEYAKLKKELGVRLCRLESLSLLEPGK